MKVESVLNTQDVQVLNFRVLYRVISTMIVVHSDGLSMSKNVNDFLIASNREINCPLHRHMSRQMTYQTLSVRESD